MANSPSPASSASPAARSSRPSSSPAEHSGGSAEFNADDVPVEVLVKHLLAAKQSLSSMTLVLRANDLATHARQLHEESVILTAQTGFLRHGINDQIRILRAVRRGMTRAYDSGKREFKHLLRTLDGANARLEQTIGMLKKTIVESVFRPPGEQGEKCLLDFVDEQSVDTMRNALKQSIAELQAAQTSFDGDLSRFDNDLRVLNKTMSNANPASPSNSSSAYKSMPHLLAALTNHSHDMAEHLTSLNRHFDMCVTAVRTTEGGAALARRKAAEVSPEEGGVSISGVITEQESNMAELAEPMDPRERAEIVQVVVQDAPEVDEVVAELQAVLQQMELDFSILKEQADRIKSAYLSTIAAFHVLEDIGSRLNSYVAAEAEYVQRWDDEKGIIFTKLEEMDSLRTFYEGYASAYDSLLLEVERRRSVEEKVQATWRKAKESVDKLIEADRKEREHFRQEIGEFLPTDLWVGMNGPLRRWEIIPVEETETPTPTATEVTDSRGSSSKREITPALLGRTLKECRLGKMAGAK
ncbi:autophagy-related protein 17 [Diplogelasinospora grovesii]|uniref:Autophagy-related protein 17 n=1 Tax=Diplogelasinospora grovesii TaxID=303347 RepID=A0AAN6MYB8_9PEZI|nr:autophagy-related protein 17 [Diplogelasinospora grovesii]